MEYAKYSLIYKDEKYIIKSDKLSSNDEKSVLFNSLEDMFKYIFDTNNKLSFFDIFKIFASNGIEYNKCELIKYYIHNSKEICDCNDEIYMKIKINKGSIYEILSILPKDLSANKIMKGVSLTLKVPKQYIPFYLSIFIKEYSIEDYYITIKNLFKDNSNIPYVDLYSHNKEYYVIKNRDKIVYISTNKEMAYHYVDVISSIRKDKSLYFVPNIELVYGFKNLVNYLKIQHLNVHINNVKNIVDFRGEFALIDGDVVCEDEYLMNDVESKYVLKTSEDDFILKDNIESMYNFVLENKIHSPEIMKLNNMKKVISDREVFKSIFLSNILNNEHIRELDGISMLENNSLIKIYSNLVQILLENEASPLIAMLFNNDTNTYDARFFLSEDSLNSYISDRGDVSLLNTHFISDEYVREKLMKKNLEILMSEENNFKSNDYVLNLSYLYSKLDRPINKIKQLKDIPCVIDVDSSLDNGMASCGIVLRDSQGRMLGKISKRLNANTSVEAEIRGAMHAIRYAILEDCREICLRYDYVGIFEYLIGEPTSEIRKEYQDFFVDIVNKYDVDIYFKKVKAHSLDEYNNLADYLAGNLNVNESNQK